MSFFSSFQPLFFLFSGSICLFLACAADQLPEPQSGDCANLTVIYETDIAPIIERSCNYSGCHLDAAPGDYSSYEGLSAFLDSGSFAQRVITLKEDPNLGMPPDFAPAGRPKNLPEEELNLLRCWIEAGYPEN